MALEPLVRGVRSDDPAAMAFAREVLRVHARYATEVVAAHRLCPFLRDVETGFGAFVVALDDTADVNATAAWIAEADNPIGHVVFPFVSVAPTAWERFSNGVGERLRATLDPAPVLAAFHPELVGDASTAHRLVGLLRRAPDPFVQFIPREMHVGGTTLGFDGAAPADPAEANFEKLRGDALAGVLASLDDIRADRDRSYAPFLSALSR